MNTTQINKATVKDLYILQKISITTFTETFAAVNKPQNIDSYVKDHLNTTQLTKELLNPQSNFFLAFYGNQLVGYLKLNTGHAQTEAQDEQALEIQRIYVLKCFQGQKIGQQLLNAALEIAYKKKASYIWLGVWEENHKAINFYQKNGFVTFDKHLFLMGQEQQTDLLMQLKINLL